MSICEPCQISKPVPVCVSNLTIGTVSLLSTNIYIYFHSIKNGRFNRTTAITDAGGVVIADLTQIKLMSNDIYEVWVTDAAADNIDDRQDVTIGATVTDCLNVEFDRIVHGENYTLSL